MKIEISNPEFYFALFYTLSFLVTFILFIVFGKKLKIPLWSLLLMLTTVSLCTILGSRFLSIPLSEWGNIIISGRFVGSPGRYGVGGLLFGLAGLLASIKALRLGKPVIDLYAWIAPIGFGIQKIGCFLNGCCYGKPSDLLWNIQYSTGTNAHFHQWVSGMINTKTEFALGLHPVQLYEVIGLFTIALIVWRSQKLFKKTGSTLLFSLSLFFLFRFFIEFVRDPSISIYGDKSLAGLTFVQWFFLVASTVCAIILIVYEKWLKPIVKIHSNAYPSIRISLLFVLIVSVVLYSMRGLFTPFELISLDIKFIPAIFLTGYHVYSTTRRVRFSLALTSFFVLPVFLIIQTTSPDTTKAITIKDFYNKEVKSYRRIDFGTSIGEYNASVKFNPQEGQCGTTYTTEDYNYIYRIFGAGYASVKQKGKVMTTNGINLYGGINKESNLTKQWEKTSFLIGANPYFKFDLNWVGIGAGVHLGHLRWVPGSPIDKAIFDRGTRFSPVLPDIYFRVGRRDIIDLRYTFNNNFPTSLPVATHEFSVGSGFGNKTNINLRFGAGVTDLDSYQFISAEGILNRQVGFTFKLNIDNGSYTGNVIAKKAGSVQIGLNYRFGFEK